MTNSLFPEAFDTDENLYLAHDALRMRLAKDYNPGDTSITVEGSILVFADFPPSGLITLTEQCSDIEERAISFSYTSIDLDAMTIDGLELLPGFPDVVKPKRITNVTQNVMADYHNNIKDALIAIEEFIGIKGTIDTQPFGETLEGRINFLRKVVLVPKAWFTANKRTGIVPLEIEFQDLSFRLGTDGTAGPVTITWDFGDNDTSVISDISSISATSQVPEDAENVLVYDTDGGKIRKTYLKAGVFDVILTVKNDFGEDSCIFKDFIKARIAAPNEAVIKFTETAEQDITEGEPSNGPYDVVPKIRSPINMLIEMMVPDGENPDDPDRSFGGELLQSGIPLDPINTYTWALGDDLVHPNSSITKASFGVGGIYDLKLRVDTDFGAYRITTYENCIDIIENINLWLWTFDDDTTVKSYEFGLISETFKLNSAGSTTITRDSSFLDDVPNEAKQKSEFRKNAGFAPRSTSNSSDRGAAMLFYASGRSDSQDPSEETINRIEYTGFTDTYIVEAPIDRPWNWASLVSPANVYFVFGRDLSEESPNTSPTNLDKTTMSLSSLATSTIAMTIDDFENGAQDLMQNISIYDNAGEPTYGRFSVTRTAWKDNTGYLLRNDGVGPYFRLKSFYRTEGTVGSPFRTMRKLSDLQGPVKMEGQLTNLSAGIFFFNNTGAISLYDDTANVWKLVGPGVNSVAYRALQDTTVQGFDDPENTLLVASDGDYRAYLSFDYTENRLLKFNAATLTFSNLGPRPSGEQWIMGIY